MPGKAFTNGLLSAPTLEGRVHREDKRTLWAEDVLRCNLEILGYA